MDYITNLMEDADKHEILTSTTVDGLLRTHRVLGSNPLGTYLQAQEQPKYVLRNRKRGLEISNQREKRFEPDDGYQTVALVTDVRILFVAGSEDGDRTVELPLREIIESKGVQSFFRKNALVIETLEDETWTFRCKDDTAQAAATIDKMAQTWANAERLLEEAGDLITATDGYRDEDDFESAHAALDDASEKIQTAARRIGGVGPRAQQLLAERAEELSERLAEVRRRTCADEGAEAHSRAQDAWAAKEYTSAAAAYESAIEAYERAIEIRGTSPDDETLSRRRKGALRERELLRVAPFVDADSARRRAASIRDSEKAATEWETALEGYRELLGLDWGSEEPYFVVNRDKIREQTIEIADDAIEDHSRAGRQWLTSGDKLAVEGYDQQAKEVYERARNQFEQAHKLATEVRPDHVDSLESALETVGRRLAGETPDELDEGAGLPDTVIYGLDEPRETAVSSVGPSGADDGTESDERGDQPDDDRGDESSKPESGTKRDGVESAETPTHDPLRSDEESSDPSTLDRIRKRKTGRATSKERERIDTGEDSGTQSSESDGPEKREKGRKIGADEPETDVDPSDDERLVELLRHLDEDEFLELVSDLWEAQGWSTTAVSTTVESMCDLIAIREGPQEERLLVWTTHRPSGGPVGTAEVRRCANAREDSRGADRAVLVTTGEPTAAARARADEFDVDIVDTGELVALLRFEKLVDTLVDISDE